MSELLGTLYERTKMVEWWNTCPTTSFKPISKAQRYRNVVKEWEKDDKCHNKVPVISAVVKYLKRLEADEVGDRRKLNSNDQKRTKNNKLHEEIVEELVNETKGKISKSEIARILDCCPATAAKIVKKLGLSQYKCRITAIVPENTIPIRLKAAKQFVEVLLHFPTLHRLIWYTDETHFDTLEELNARILSRSRPDISVAGVQKERYPKRFTLWGAMHYEHGMIWFTNFTNDVGNYGNVNQFNYHDCLTYFFSELDRRFTPEQISQMWFQQDGASCHTSFISRAFIFSKFGERLIDRNSEGDNSLGLFWPPFSCCLNPCDFTLWPQLKRPVRKRWAEYERDTVRMRAIVDDECRKLNEGREISGFFRNSIDSIPKRMKAMVWSEGKPCDVKDYECHLKQMERERDENNVNVLNV